MSAQLRLIGARLPGDMAPVAYTGPYPIRSHRTLAQVAEGSLDLRIEQDNVDADWARDVVRTYRIPPRRIMPEVLPLAQRVSMAAGLFGGALLTGGAICVIALTVLALGGAQ